MNDIQRSELSDLQKAIGVVRKDFEEIGDKIRGLEKKMVVIEKNGEANKAEILAVRLEWQQVSASIKQSLAELTAIQQGHERVLRGEAGTQLIGLIDIVQKNSEAVQLLVRIKDSDETKEKERRRLFSVAAGLLVLVEALQILFNVAPDLFK